MPGMGFPGGGTGGEVSVVPRVIRVVVSGPWRRVSLFFSSEEPLFSGGWIVLRTGM